MKTEEKRVREEKLLLWIAKKSHENHRDGTTAQPSWTTRRAWAWGENFSSPERRASTSTACCVNNGTGEEGMERSEVEAEMALACLLLRLLCALAYRALLKSSFNFRTWLSWRVVVTAFFFLFSSLAACVYIYYIIPSISIALLLLRCFTSPLSVSVYHCGRSTTLARWLITDFSCQCVVDGYQRTY